MMNKHMKIVAIAGAAIVALAIGLLVGFATKEEDTTVVTTSSALAAYGTTTDSTTSYETTIYQSSEGGSKSGKGSYEYYSGKSGKGVKGGKCKWKYYK
jgi:3-polyprenyl-4-hydroxybenzoate decarboxylase